MNNQLTRIIGFIFLSTCLILPPLNSMAQKYSTGDTLFVWNINGTNLMNDTSSGSLVLASLPLGARAVVIDPNPKTIKHLKTVEANLALDGFWVKVNVGDVAGYIFDGDCSVVNPRPDLNEYRSFLKCFLGKKIDEKKVSRTLKIDKNEYKVVDEITRYENGEYTYAPFDGCFDHTYSFYTISFNEAYHAMINAYTDKAETMDGVGLGGPTFVNMVEGVYTFTGVEATGEIQIRIKKNTIEIFSYDCD